MGSTAAATVRALVAPPRQPWRRLVWGSRVLGPALALPLALVVTGWLVGSTTVLPGLIGIGVLAGVALGLAWARGARVAGWLTAALVVGVPLTSWWRLPDPAPGLLVAAATGVLVALGALVLPARLADGLTAMLLAERRQWWRASLRAARLTRRTIGLGVYRQLCRTGFIRVLSVTYPGRVYLVPRRTSPSGARVLVEEHGHVIGGLCLRPRQPLPDPEEVVAHVLWLRGDERGYLAAANFFPYDTTLTPQATARRV